MLLELGLSADTGTGGAEAVLLHLAVALTYAKKLCLRAFSLLRRSSRLRSWVESSWRLRSAWLSSQCCDAPNLTIESARAFVTAGPDSTALFRIVSQGVHAGLCSGTGFRLPVPEMRFQKGRNKGKLF